MVNHERVYQTANPSFSLGVLRSPMSSRSSVSGCEPVHGREVASLDRRAVIGRDELETGYLGERLCAEVGDYAGPQMPKASGRCDVNTGYVPKAY